MAIGRVDGADWQEMVLEADTPVLVEFHSGTCPVCTAMEPRVRRIAVEFEGRAPVLKVDVGTEEDLVWAYEVMSTPTFIIFKDGEPWHIMAGEVDHGLLQDRLEDALASRDRA